MEPKKETQAIHALAEQLDRLVDVTQFDEGGQKQADIVAEGLAHISESLSGFQELFARLQAPGLTDEEKLDLLWDLGEELRHVDEHIHDMAYFDSQINDEENDEESPRNTLDS
jgi:hypothetical protein